MKTMIIDFKEKVIEQQDRIIEVLKQAELSDLFEQKKADIQMLLDKSQPSLMFYGVYNAGKSSLLNAIFGELKASVADIPETHKVTY